MSGYGYDEIGIFKTLSDGCALRVTKQFYNTLLTLSSSQADQGWRDGW